MAGSVISDKVILGESSTDSHNFLIKTNNDGTLTIARGSTGSLGNILNVDVNGLITFTQGKQLTLSTAQATTSGTSIDFTGIPSWVKRVTFMFSGLSTNGSSHILLQIGSGSVQVTGYLGAITFTGGGTSGTTLTAGFGIGTGVVAGSVIHGQATLAHASGNAWTCGVSGGFSTTTAGICGGGGVTLGGVLDRIRLTTVNGTDTFDAGSVNILYEG